MLKELFGNSSWLGKIIQLVLISLLFLMTGFFIWTIFGGNPNSIDSQKILQLITAVFFFILPVAFLGYFWYEKPIEAFYLNKMPAIQQITLVVLLMISVQPFINLLAYFNEQIHLPAALKGLEELFKEYETRAGELTKEFLNVKTGGGYLFNLFLMALLPAFGEELFFRGAMQNVFSEKFSKITAVWITAVIFSLIHFQMYGFIPRMLLGAMFGYILVWTRTLWLPILAHFVNNALAVSVTFFSGNDNQLENFGKADTYVYGVISGIISIFILWMIYKPSRTNIKNI
ncbi:Abortive infection protein [uncultured Paludibacter sp.]|uniref:Abortive infection protein n=1 Tax=uncultured Paludibacter sp. TaxID=497635 RepID=A0A653AFY7_9BACT|nr:Abortive infection protein [uncultured Paludibacter sp.]